MSMSTMLNRELHLMIVYLFSLTQIWSFHIVVGGWGLGMEVVVVVVGGGGGGGGGGQNLDNRNFHQIDDFLRDFARSWSNWAQFLSFASQNNDRIRSKWPKFAENIPLAMEPQPKLDPWLWKSSMEIGLKKGPLRSVHHFSQSHYTDSTVSLMMIDVNS